MRIFLFFVLVMNLAYSFEKNDDLVKKITFEKSCDLGKNEFVRKR